MPDQSPQTSHDPEDYLELVEQQMLDYWLEIDKYGRFTHPPKNNDELHEFIRIALGFDIPRKVVTPGHSAPFDFVADLFFERTKTALGFANRTGGKTCDIAILNFLDMLFKPGCEISNAGATRDQAKKCFNYFLAFMDKKWFKDFCDKYRFVTGKPFIVKQIQEETTFDTKATQQIITATEKGVRGPHPHKSRMDEVDEIDWDILQTGLSMSRSDPKNIRERLPILGQNALTSTRQKARGSMQRLLDEAPQRGIDVYQWNVWEVLERCPRRCFDDPTHGTCPVYVYCKGKAHQCDGFYAIDDFIEKARNLDPDKFATEWLNTKPASDKLVYPMFDTTTHVLTERDLFQRFGCTFPKPEWPRISGTDFGGGPTSPFVYVKICELPDRTYLVFHEYVAFQRVLRDHAKNIKASPYYLRGEWNFTDHDAQERIELKDHMIVTKPADKAVLAGIDYLTELLLGYPPDLKPRLYVYERCPFVISEFSAYHWPSRPDGKVDKSSKPAKEYDHSMDAIRYALYSSKRRQRTGYRMRTVEGL